MQRAQGMRKARMLRRLVCKKRESELFDAPQALKLRRVNQSNEQLSGGCVGFEPNDIVNRIAVNFLRQFLLPKISEN